MKIVLILLLVSLFISCGGQNTNTIKVNTTNASDENSYENANEIDPTDTSYFNIVKDYIREVGTIRKVNASSLVTKKMIVTYHEVSIDSMLISVDNTNRIYMTLNNRHFGNIINENNTVSPEINYGVPDTNPQLTKEKEQVVLELYQKLIIQALKK